MYALRWCTEEPGKLVSIAQTYSLLFPSARTPKVCGCVRNKNKRKCQNHSTQDSRVVPHRGTNWAALWLTSQIGRDAVLSESYGRGYCVHCVHTLYALPLWQHTTQINSLRTAHHSVPSPAEPALKRASAAHTTRPIQSDHGSMHTSHSHFILLFSLFSPHACTRLQVPMSLP